MEPIFAYAHLNARIMPADRGEWYEDPLHDALEERGLGEVTGGGTMQTAEGEISYCGIDLDLIDPEQSVPFVCETLERLGAPKGSHLEYDRDGIPMQVPFGKAEGLAVYLNGTDLPDEVYQNSDLNELVDEFQRLLGDEGAFQGHWQGPTETALYLYGRSAEVMRERIAPCLAATPLCQKARVVQIA